MTQEKKDIMHPTKHINALMKMQQYGHFIISASKDQRAAFNSVHHPL